MRGDSPYLGDRCGAGACAGMGKAVEVFNRTQDIVVDDALIIATGLDHGPDEERHNPVILILMVLIPRHDQQAVVLLRPLDVGIQMFLEPTVAGLNRLGVLPVVHVLTWFGTITLIVGSLL
jgi:hypothetical protein